MNQEENRSRSKKSFFSSLFKKYRLVLLNDATFGEKLSIRISPVGIGAFVSIFISIVTIVTAFLIKSTDSIILPVINNKADTVSLFTILFGSISVLVVITSLLSYLNKSNRRIVYTTNDAATEYKIKKLFEQYAPGKIDLDKVYETISKDASENLEIRLIKKFSEKYSKEAISNSRIKKLNDSLKNSLERLNTEIINTSRRSNLNLVIGIVSTFFAIFGFTTVLYLTNAMTTDVISYFLPRIGLVIFVQIFAYFFLRLYKKGMEDIKYYQNEVTNVESKISAIEYSLVYEPTPEIQKTIVELLMKNERNAILKGKYTTHSLEMEKLNNDSNFDKLFDMLKNLRTKP